MKAGLVGCGNWGRLILRDLKAQGCRVAVVARNPGGVANARAGGADEIVGHIDDLPQVDGVVVAVPTTMHGEVVLLLAERGCPIFCEKPLTSDVASARRIVDVAGERVFVMDKWRYHPGVLALRDVARGGELGPVLGMRMERVQWGHGHEDVDMAWTLLPHDLSIALEVFGFLPTPTHANAESDDEGLVTLFAWLSGSAWLHCEVGTRSPQHRRRVELRCRDGVAVLGDAYDPHITLLRTRMRVRHGEPPEWERRPIAGGMPLAAELAAFVAYVGGTGPRPVSSAAEGLQVVETIAELHRLAGLPA